MTQIYQTCIPLACAWFDLRNIYFFWLRKCVFFDGPEQATPHYAAMMILKMKDATNVMFYCCVILYLSIENISQNIKAVSCTVANHLF